MKSKLFGLLLLSCLFCLACEMRTVSSTSTSSVPIEYGSEAIITKKHNETGGLYSRHYELTIRGNGKVTLDGNFNNPTPVHAEWSIPRENFSRLVAAFEESKFHTIKEESGKLLIDGGVMTISISVNGKEKQVKRYFDLEGSEEQKTISRLASIINQEAGAEPYIRKCCHFPANYSSESIP